MARKKRSSSVLEKANVRISAVKSIDASFDLGNDVTAVTYAAQIATATSALDDYNTLLSNVDDKLNVLKDAEKALRNFNERVLTGVASKFGKDSSEYEMAGGTRKSEQKKRTRKPKPTA